jgi:hypothetical protein
VLLIANTSRPWLAQVDSHRDLPRVDQPSVDGDGFLRRSARCRHAGGGRTSTSGIPAPTRRCFAAAVDEISSRRIGFDRVGLGRSRWALEGSLAEPARLRWLRPRACNGLAEMEEVAEATPRLSAPAQARLTRAEALRQRSAQAFDRKAAEARFAELLGETAVAARAGG